MDFAFQVNSNQLPYDKKAFVKDAILKKHRHQYEGNKTKSNGEHGSHASNMSKLPLIRSLADIGKNHSTSKSKTCCPFCSVYATFSKRSIIINLNPVQYKSETLTSW